jgi:hypothetical protein
MIFTDPVVLRWLQASIWFGYLMEAVFAAGVIVVGKLWLRLLFGQAGETEGSQPDSLRPAGSDEV